MYPHTRNARLAALALTALLVGALAPLLGAWGGWSTRDDAERYQVASVTRGDILSAHARRLKEANEASRHLRPERLWQRRG